MNPVNRLPYGYSNITRIYNSYKQKNKKFSISNFMTREDFEKFIFQDCFYCGSPPLQINKHISYRSYGYVKYNGIDRVDNTVGYTKDNCVTCCGICNKMKNNMTLEEFKEKIKILYLKFFNVS